MNPLAAAQALTEALDRVLIELQQHTLLLQSIKTNTGLTAKAVLEMQEEENANEKKQTPI